MITPDRYKSDSEKPHLIDTKTPVNTTPDTQSDGTIVNLVDLDVQAFTPAPGTIPDAVDASKTLLISMPHHQLPPLPGLEPLSPSPYK